MERCQNDIVSDTIFNYLENKKNYVQKSIKIPTHCAGS